jgi:hypothetical protein
MGDNTITELYNIDTLLTEMEEIIFNSKITRHTKAHYLRNVAIQTWTEHYPSRRRKVKGCKYWSEKAYRQTFDPTYDGVKECLFHEHVIPKKWLIENVFLKKENEGKLLDKEYHRYYLTNFTFACVVTESEHNEDLKNFSSEMPPEFLEMKHPDYLKLWLRYIYSKVPVLEVTWDQRRNPAGTKLLNLHSIVAEP